MCLMGNQSRGIFLHSSYFIRIQNIYSKKKPYIYIYIYSCSFYMFGVQPVLANFKTSKIGRVREVLAILLRIILLVLISAIN